MDITPLLNALKRRAAHRVKMKQKAIADLARCMVVTSSDHALVYVENLIETETGRPSPMVSISLIREGCLYGEAESPNLIFSREGEQLGHPRLNRVLAFDFSWASKRTDFLLRYKWRHILCDDPALDAACAIFRDRDMQAGLSETLNPGLYLISVNDEQDSLVFSRIELEEEEF